MNARKPCVKKDVLGASTAGIYLKNHTDVLSLLWGCGLGADNTCLMLSPGTCVACSTKKDEFGWLICGHPPFNSEEPLIPNPSIIHSPYHFISGFSLRGDFVYLKSPLKILLLIFLLSINRGSSCPVLLGWCNRSQSSCWSPSGNSCQWWGLARFDNWEIIGKGALGCWLFSSLLEHRRGWLRRPHTLWDKVKKDNIDRVVKVHPSSNLRSSIC